MFKSLQARACCTTILQYSFHHRLNQFSPLSPNKLTVLLTLDHTLTDIIIDGMIHIGSPLRLGYLFKVIEVYTA